ncbi:MAG: hypothetical protein Q8L20_16850 [Gammaproteobacteria bacterium]|nr:hypothetical protein [Gammaproteobacteria bacterium]
MINGKYSTLHAAVSAIALASLCSSNTVLAQAANELDLTISVIQAGETPNGFINRLALPTLDALVDADAVTQTQAEVIAEAVTETVRISDNASQVATDRIREIISVDGVGVGGGVGGGAGGGVGGGVGGGIGGGTGVGIGVGGIPPAVVDILNPNLPLGDTLTQTSDRLDGVVDNLPGNAPDVGSIVGGGVSAGGVLNNLTIDSAVDSAINANADAIVDNLDVPINDSVDSVVNDIVNDANNVPLEDLQDLPISGIPATDSLSPLTDGVPEIPEIPGL